MQESYHMPESSAGLPARQALASYSQGHKPVMLDEVVSFLRLSAGQIAVDATLGLGGHASAILREIVPGGRLIGIDKDAESLGIARQNLNFCEDCTFVRGDFRNIDKILAEHHIQGIDAALFDLGISSYQLESPARGFSLKREGPLDMRMDRDSFISAYDLLNNLTEEEISSILWKFGQERFSYRIARRVVEARKEAPIASTQELARLILKSLPSGARFRRIHPATKVFQALRIAVNRELDCLDEALVKTCAFLNKGARVCVISFHSLEDKIVKERFREFAAGKKFELVVKKVLRPSLEEIRRNPRSRSAKMRVIERRS